MTWEMSVEPPQKECPLAKMQSELEGAHEDGDTVDMMISRCKIGQWSSLVQSMLRGWRSAPIQCACAVINERGTLEDG